MTQLKSDQTRQNLHLKEIRELAQRFTPQELEKCIAQQLEQGSNPCEPDGSTQEVINVLAKAEFVKDLINSGMSLPEAIRELGRRIRLVQDGFQEI
jgi:hypothetical protein